MFRTTFHDPGAAHAHRADDRRFWNMMPMVST
jgi:hypothetical protein